MTRWIRSFWDEEHATFFWEIGEDGWVTRGVEWVGPEDEVRSAAALEEVLHARDTVGIEGVQEYESRYGVLTDQPIRDWDFPHEDIDVFEFERVWVQARQVLEDQHLERVEWITVYDLREDAQLTEAIQNATLTHPQYGLDPSPALFGSDDWWQGLADGRIPRRTEVGAVSAVRWTGMGDWPEWTFRGDDGVEREWTREGDHTRYVAGLRARIEVVTVRWKPGASTVVTRGDDPEHDMLIRVELEASERRSEAHGPGPFPGAYDDLREQQQDDRGSQPGGRGRPRFGWWRRKR